MLTLFYSPDEFLVESMPIAKKIAIATGAVDYNILQNNGENAHQVWNRAIVYRKIPILHITQVVPHVHFHVIPKPSESQESGLVVGWPVQNIPKEELKALHEEITAKLAKL